MVILSPQLSGLHLQRSLVVHTGVSLCSTPEGPPRSCVSGQTLADPEFQEAGPRLTACGQNGVQNQRLGQAT